MEGANSRVGSVKAENIFFANLTTETKHLYSFLYLKYHLGVSNMNFKKHRGIFKLYKGQKGLGSMFSRFKQPCLRHGRILILKFVKNIIIKMIICFRNSNALYSILHYTELLVFQHWYSLWTWIVDLSWDKTWQVSPVLVNEILPARGNALQLKNWLFW